MKKAVLLGDSISLDMYGGYGKRVAELLKDEFEIWQPEDNCRYSLYTFRSIFDWAEKIKGADVIHWNNGAWDASDVFGDGPLLNKEDYIKTILRIHAILSTFSSRIIFATTTPTREGNPRHDNQRVNEYNAAAVEELTKRGVMIDDLNAVISEDVNGNIREDDMIHLTEKGSILCAASVAESIRKAFR